MLEKKKDGGGGGGGGSGGEMTAEQMELLMRLLRIAMGEAELRGRTRALDRFREEDKNYGDKAVVLHDDQLTLRDVLAGIMDRISNPQALQLLGQAETAMLDAAGQLRKPDTGATTIAAETEVIELLLAGTNQEAQSMSAAAAAMAQMMQQMMGMGGAPGMGMGSGQGGGGSMAGGFTDRGNDPVTGDQKGDRVTGKEHEGLAGSALSRVPQEFRDVLQSYFGELEGQKR